MTVNDLSNTIDLPSTLVRAEALFYRFQRTVDAIDKKHSFPAAPTARQRKAIAGAAADGEAGASGAVASGADATNAAATKGKGKAKGGEVKTSTNVEDKVISPELRKLLSRKVEVLEKQTDEGKGAKK
jgi:hypothetical protein